VILKVELRKTEAASFASTVNRVHVIATSIVVRANESGIRVGLGGGKILPLQTERAL